MDKVTEKQKTELQEDFESEWIDYIKENEAELKETHKNPVIRWIAQPIYSSELKSLAQVFFLRGRLFELRGKRLDQISDEIKH